MLDRCSPRRGGDSCLRPVQPNGSPMSPQTDAERELAQLLVESLNLEEVEPGSIDPEAPLFNTGLGLDSIDALELALASRKSYGFQLLSDNDENRRSIPLPTPLSPPGQPTNNA